MIVLRSGAVLRSGRNPFEAYLLAACFLVGVAGLVAPESQSSVVTHLPRWEVASWYGGLVAGSGVCLAGIAMRGVKSLLVERVGLLMLAAFSVLYSVAVLAAAGARGTFVAVFIAAFAGAAVGRFVQISIDMHRAEAVEALRPDKPGGD